MGQRRPSRSAAAAKKGSSSVSVSSNVAAASASSSSSSSSPDFWVDIVRLPTRPPKRWKPFESESDQQVTTASKGKGKEKETEKADVKVEPAPAPAPAPTPAPMTIELEERDELASDQSVDKSPLQQEQPLFRRGSSPKDSPPRPSLPQSIPIEVRSDSEAEAGVEADVEDAPSTGNRSKQIASLKRKQVSPQPKDSDQVTKKKQKKLSDSDQVTKQKQKKVSDVPTNTKAKHKSTTKKKKKKKHRVVSPDGDDEDEDDLQADLNADAFARSTGTSQRKDFAAKLKKFKAARKKATVISDSDADSSSGETSTDDDSSSDDDSVDSDTFIVDDEPRIDKKQPKKGPAARPPSAKPGAATTQKKANGRPGGGYPGPALPPHRSSILNTLGGRRLELGEACYEYCRWLVVKILGLTIPPRLEEQLWEARQHCQRYADDSRRMIVTMAMRRQFTWYLNHYPSIERRHLFSNQVKAHRGCAACHRSAQACDSRIILGGKPYDRKSLHFLEPDEDEAMSSDLSSDAEDQAQHAKPDDHEFYYNTRRPPPKKVHLFYVGSHCADRAMLYHSLGHWEYKMLQSMYKSSQVKELLAAQEGPESKEVTPDDIEAVAELWKGKLRDQLTKARAAASKMAAR